MIYHNLDPASPRRLRSFLKWRLDRRKLPPAPPDLAEPPLVAPGDGAGLWTGHNTLTWIGHASVIVQLDRMTILCDPVWSQTISGVVPRRSALPFDLVRVPQPDAVLISHNHYDHLDLPTLHRLGKHTRLIVPDGLRTYLLRRGFRHVQELGWWESMRLGDLDVTFVPAQHWSRRLPWDTNKTWWGGWMIEGSQRLYFAGDTGFFSGFTEIGKRFPALDWAMLPIGAYAPRWIMQPVHMNPEEAGTAFTLLGARKMLPIHWGTFRLTDEPPGEPPRRLKAWWSESGLDPERLWLPDLGATRQLVHGDDPSQ